MRITNFILSLILICTPCLADIKTDNIHMTADVFELDGSKKMLMASRNVVVKQKDVVITSKRAEYNQKKQIVKLFNTVKLTKGDVQIFCEEAVADGVKEVVEVNGNVIFKVNDITGNAGKAVYDMKSKWVYLMESPHAKQGEDVITADKIMINLDEEKIITKGSAHVKLSLDNLKEKGKSK